MHIPEVAPRAEVAEFLRPFEIGHRQRDDWCFRKRARLHRLPEIALIVARFLHSPLVEVHFIRPLECLDRGLHFLRHRREPIERQAGDEGELDARSREFIHPIEIRLPLAVHEPIAHMPHPDFLQRAFQLGEVAVDGVVVMHVNVHADRIDERIRWRRGNGRSACRLGQQQANDSGN